MNTETLTDEPAQSSTDRDSSDCCEDRHGYGYVIRWCESYLSGEDMSAGTCPA